MAESYDYVTEQIMATFTGVVAALGPVMDRGTQVKTAWDQKVAPDSGSNILYGRWRYCLQTMFEFLESLPFEPSNTYNQLVSFITRWFCFWSLQGQGLTPELVEQFDAWWSMMRQFTPISDDDKQLLDSYLDGLATIKPMIGNNFQQYFECVQSGEMNQIAEAD